MFAGGVIVGDAFTVTEREAVFVLSATAVAVMVAFTAPVGAMYVAAAPLAVD